MENDRRSGARSAVSDRADADVLAKLRKEVPELRRRFHVVDLKIFGSRARDGAAPESDLDLLVTFDSEASLFDLVELELYLKGRLGVAVDVVTPNSVKSRIRKRILDSAIAV